MGDSFPARDQVIRKVVQCLGPEADKSGDVLYNGWRTLRPGSVYLMGLNPGGDPCGTPRTVLNSLTHSDLDRDDYSAYNERWDWRGKPVAAGTHPHQRRVAEMLRCLGIANAADVFAANAIFIRSTGQESLIGAQELWRRCWPVHQLFLSIVRPRVILCLGNGERLSAFALLLGTSKNPHVEHAGAVHGHVKHFNSSLDLGDCGQLPRCTVIGVRHPSRFGVSESAKAYLASLRQLLAT